MCAFVVLDLVFAIPSQEIVLGKRLRNDPFRMKWDVKPQRNQLVSVWSRRAYMSEWVLGAVW